VRVVVEFLGKGKLFAGNFVEREGTKKFLRYSGIFLGNKLMHKGEMICRFCLLRGFLSCPTHPNLASPGKF